MFQQSLMTTGGEATAASPAPSLRTSNDGRLMFGVTPVRVRRCFPWTEPTRFFSLRDEKEYEVALVESLDGLDEASRLALELAIAESGFLLEIEAIEEVDEEYELRNWKVRTAQGRRTFQTKIDEWPRRVPGGGLLLRDVSGDLLVIRRPEALDAESRRILWAYVD